MTLKFSRAGLLALAGALLLAIVLSVPTIHASYAEDAPAAAPAAAAPAAAAPPACDGNAKPPVLENCTPNSGDTAWMLTSMAIVLMMTIPGLALFYGGMVRKKNVGDTVMTSFAITCLISILWLFFTYSLAFRAGTPFIGGLDRAFLQGIVSDVAKGIGNPNPLAPKFHGSYKYWVKMARNLIAQGGVVDAFFKLLTAHNTDSRTISHLKDGPEMALAELFRSVVRSPRHGIVRHIDYRLLGYICNHVLKAQGRKTVCG